MKNKNNAPDDNLISLDVNETILPVKFYGLSIFAFIFYLFAFFVVMVDIYMIGEVEKITISFSNLVQLLSLLLMPVLFSALFALITKIFFRVEYLKSFVKITNFMNWLVSILVLTFIFLAKLMPMFVLSSKDSINCNDLVGTWKEERYENKLKAHKIDFVRYKKDGTFSAETIFKSKEKIWQHIESGTWKCNGKDLMLYTTVVNGNESYFKDDYEILILNKLRRKFKQKKVNCENIITDCTDTNEAVRWIELNKD